MMKIARLALAGLLTSVSAQVYASGLVLNDNELRNDLSWLSDRELSSLAFRPGPEPGRDYPGVKAKPPILLNRWCWRVLISAFLIKADFRVSGYTSPISREPAGVCTANRRITRYRWPLITAATGGMFTCRAMLKAVSVSATVPLQCQRRLRRGEVLEPVAVVWPDAAVGGPI
jgi:hypothetical protein